MDQISFRAAPRRRSRRAQGIAVFLRDLDETPSVPLGTVPASRGALGGTLPTHQSMTVDGGAWLPPPPRLNHALQMRRSASATSTMETPA
jgi:hypothetical protein